MTDERKDLEPVRADAQAVLDFWFGASTSAGFGAQRTEWFKKDPAFDDAIRERFSQLIEQALRGELVGWAATERGALAQIIVLDQFTRNVFRDTERAFAGDARALAAASAMVGTRQDDALPPFMRAFAYMPFEHAEGIAMQDEAVRLFTRLAASDAGTSNLLDYAIRHRDVIERFGRFPHRNDILGRRSTAEEDDYLSKPGSGF